jgi:Flp pilus assembly protein TadG
MSRFPIVRRMKRLRRPEEGYVLVMTALMLLGLMVMAAFTIDVGLWYSRANRLQRAADSAALAGVTYMPNLTQAYAVAMDAAKKNGFDSANVQLNVQPEAVPGAPRRLKVTLTDTNVPAIFGSMLMDHISITRRRCPSGAP